MVKYSVCCLELLLFASQISKYFCIFTEISTFEQVSQQTKIIGMKTVHRVLVRPQRFSFSGKLPPSSFCMHNACLVRGPAATPLVLVAQELNAWAWWSDLPICSSGFLGGFVLV